MVRWSWNGKDGEEKREKESRKRRNLKGVRGSYQKDWRRKEGQECGDEKKGNGNLGEKD